MRLDCPHCHEPVELADEYLGQEVECGACNRPFLVSRHHSQLFASEVIYTTPIEDDDRHERRSRELDGLALGSCSLILGGIGLLLLPVSVCCSAGVLGSLISGLGIIMGVLGLFRTKTNSHLVHIIGLTLNIIVFAICGIMFANVIWK
jgi:hypothetical protein